MKIGIDGNEANVDKKVGIGEYAYELLVEFSKPLSSEIEFEIFLKTEPRVELPKTSGNWKYNVFGPKKLWTQIALPLNLFMDFPKPDVFFSPTHYAPRFSPVPTVISVMDLSYVHYPELFKKSDLYQLRNWTSYSVKAAKRILTISNSSKDDIIKLYHVPEDRVIVTYPGVKQAAQINSSMEKLKEKYTILGEFILFVGTLQPRKNIVRLIEAYSKLVAQSKKVPQLVIVGKKGWLYEDILSAPKRFGVEKGVIFLEFVPDSDLALLYRNALCFVLRSLYEGFGLPILEAMRYGCPVVTSNVSSLPEAAGDAAVYIDPNNTEDIAQKLKLVISDLKLREELIEKGKKQVQKFSWEKAAKETLEILKGVTSSGKNL